MDLREKEKLENDCKHPHILASSGGTYACSDCQLQLSEKKLSEMIGIKGVEEIKQKLTYLVEIPEETLQDLAIQETENTKAIQPRIIQFRYVKDPYSITLEVNKEENDKITKREIVFICIVLGGGVVACIIFFLFYFSCPPFYHFINWLLSGVDWK